MAPGANHYHCSHGNCKSDGRRQPEMRFATFPKKSVDEDRARRWAELMCRDDFNVDSITKNSKVCELHFPENVDLDYRLIYRYYELSVVLKVGLFEKHTKFGKIFLMLCTSNI